MQKREFCGMNCILLLNLLETLDFFKRGGGILEKISGNHAESQKEYRRHRQRLGHGRAGRGAL